MKEIILKYLNELGTELEKSYGDKLIVLEEKDFEEFAEKLVKKLTITAVVKSLKDYTEKEKWESFCMWQDWNCYYFSGIYTYEGKEYNRDEAKQLYKTLKKAKNL